MHEELHAQQGLAAACAATNQGGSALGQAATGQFIQTLDSGT
jgi:hypothetical protein